MDKQGHKNNLNDTFILFCVILAKDCCLMRYSQEKSFLFQFKQILSLP